MAAGARPHLGRAPSLTRMPRLLLLFALLAAGTGRAQTTDFVAVLSDGPPPGATPGTGFAHVRLVDNPAPGTDRIEVRGQFRALATPYLSSGLLTAPSGPPAQALMPGLAPDGTAGGWGADLNTFTVSDAVSAAILGGTASVEVQTTSMLGAIRGTLRPLGAVIDGRATESGYVTVATKATTNAGFGPNIDATSVRVFLGAPGAQVAVVAVTGRLNTGSNDGIGLWLGRAGTGAPAGTALGGTPSAGHYLGDTAHPGYKADFPVALAFALNPGGAAASTFLDVVRYADATARAADYLGAAAQDGGIAVGPPDLTANDGTSAPPLPDVVFAFRNDGAAGSGFEIVLPRTALGLTPTATGTSETITAAAFVVSGTAFFSDVTVPGAITGGNPGFDPNFGVLAGGPFSATGGGFTALAGGPEAGAALRLVGPNPTAARTRLALALDAPQAVRVDLVDALGRTVATLHDGLAPAGDLFLDVDASTLPAGVYAPSRGRRDRPRRAADHRGAVRHVGHGFRDSVPQTSPASGRINTSSTTERRERPATSTATRATSSAGMRRAGSMPDPSQDGVSVAPGSSVVMPMPEPFVSSRSARASPSRPCFAAP